MLQKELAKRLKARYDTKMDGNEWMEVSSDGIPLCRIILFLRVYLKTVYTPKQRVFSNCWTPFFLQYAEYSCKKMASSAGKSLAVGHISGFQIDPNFKKV